MVWDGKKRKQFPHEMTLNGHKVDVSDMKYNRMGGMTIERLSFVYNTHPDAFTYKPYTQKVIIGGVAADFRCLYDNKLKFWRWRSLTAEQRKQQELEEAISNLKLKISR